MSSEKKPAEIHSSMTVAQREAMAKILDQVIGTPLERTGDIAIEVAGKRYVFKDQTGGHAAVSVARPGGMEIVRDDDA